MMILMRWMEMGIITYMVVCAACATMEYFISVQKIIPNHWNAIKSSSKEQKSPAFILIQTVTHDSHRWLHPLGPIIYFSASKIGSKKIEWNLFIEMHGNESIRLNVEWSKLSGIVLLNHMHIYVKQQILRILCANWDNVSSLPLNFILWFATAR